MTFDGFTTHDFDAFAISDLEGRMQAIRERIQPKFKAIGDLMTEYAAMLTGQEMYLHIAKHARRKTNPPASTWLAVCHHKRGYKSYPHYQIGLFDDRVFIRLALIYELPHKQAIAARLLAHADEIKSKVPDDYLLSVAQMKKDASRLGGMPESVLRETLVRFRDVKKAEWLIGRHVYAGDPLLADGEGFVSYTKETFETLLPLFRLAMETAAPDSRE